MPHRTLITVVSALLCATPALAGPQHADTSTHTADLVSSAVPYSSVRALPGGGTEYVYLINGVQNRSTVPPTGFDPDHASAAQLREYGYPQKPTGSRALARWERDVHARRPANPGPVHVLDMTANLVSTTQPNWSGYQMQQTSVDTPYVSASATFTQPTYQPTCDQSATEVSWVGLGDNGGGGLIQAGTAMQNGTYWAFYEYLNRSNQNPMITLPLSVPPGDQMDVFVSYDTTNNVGNFYVTDVTANQAQSMSTPVDPSYWDGSVADFIDERAQVNSAYTPLANYGQNNWSAVSAQDEAGNTVNLDSPNITDNQVFMTNGSGAAISEPSVNTGQTFTDVWDSCQ